VDWSRAAAERDLLAFTERLARLRREHPVFRRRRFFLPGDIQWLTPSGTEMTEGDWQAGYAKSVAVLLDGTAISEPDPRGDPVTDNKFLLLFNAGAEPIDFTLPEPRLGGEWEIMIDTTYPEGLGPADTEPKSKVEVAGRAVVVLMSEA
jgi:glycogen operon protein